MIAIIGAGLAGLSAAWHLHKRGLSHIVFERLDEPGGLCRSYVKNGYTFDLAGHFLHLHTAEGGALAKKFLGPGLVEYARRASVRTYGVRVPFPFQANLGGLPPDVNLECLLGFIDAFLGATGKAKLARALASPPGLASGTPSSRMEYFDRWVLQTFGEGMANHFFFPYNSKFWRRDLGRMLVDWTTWSIPRPSLEEVIRGSLGLPNEEMGYNPRFLYPRKGGIGPSVRYFADKVKNIRLNTSAREIDSAGRIIALDNGEEIRYSAMISSIPLPALVAMIRGVDPSIRRAARRLSWLAVDSVQLGIKRSGVFNDHWSYIPEPAYPFYRVGRYPGEGKGTRLFIEFTRRNGERFAGEKRLVDSAINGVRKLGILKAADKIEEAHTVSLDPAYVVYDRARKRELPRILAYLRKRRIFSIGRYGAWEYSAMEGALLEGKRAAESL